MKNNILVWLLLTISSTSYAEETSELDPISVMGKNNDLTNLSPEESSTSTLDTGISEINLNIEELKGVAGTQGDPLGAVKFLPGIVSADSAESGSNAGFFVRGSNANENAIWVDGLPIGYIYHFGGRFSVLNPDTISSFNTYLGGFGVEYGDRLGGVVSVTTRKPLRDKLHQSYQLGFYDASFKLEGPVSENSSAYFAFRRSYFDLLLPKVGNLPDSKNTYTQFPQFWDMQAKYHYELENGELDFSVFAADDQLKINVADEKDINPDPELEGKLGAKTAYQTYGVKWRHNISTNLEQIIRTGLLKRKVDFNIGTQLSDANPNKGEGFGVKSLSDSYFLLPSWQWQSFNSQSWKAGIDLYSINYGVSGFIAKPCSIGQPDCTFTGQEKFSLNESSTAQSIAPYIELKQELTSRLFATIGLRNTKTKVNKFSSEQLSPRLNLEYDLNDRTILTASWGKFVQLPQGHEIIKDIGNDSLVMTQAEHRVLGIKYELSSQWSAQVEAYYKPMTKLVVARDAPENYANEGSGIAQGIDIFLKKKWKDRSFGWITYSYSKSERTDEGTNSKRLFTGEQPHTLNMIYNQPFTGSWKNWVWGMNLRMHTGLPYTDITGRQSKPKPGETITEASCTSNPEQEECYWKGVYGKTNGKRLPLYLNLDLSMERKWKYADGDITARFELLNITGLFRPNTIGYEYENDFSNYNNPDAVADFPFFPSFSIKATF